jgi:hypothetical protein
MIITANYDIGPGVEVTDYTYTYSSDGKSSADRTLAITDTHIKSVMAV